MQRLLLSGFALRLVWRATIFSTGILMRWAAYRDWADAFTEKYRGLISMAFGFAAGLAFYDGVALLADLGLLLLFALTGARRPHGAVMLVALAVAITAPYTTIHYMPLWVAARLLLLSSVMRALGPDLPWRGITVGAMVAMFIQTLALVIIGPGFDGRPAGFTDNASTLGEQGLMLGVMLLAAISGTGWPRARQDGPWYLRNWDWLAGFAAASAMVTLFFAESRAALLAVVALAFVYTISRRQLWIAVTALCAVIGLAALLAVTGYTRVGLNDLRTTVESRLDNWRGGEQSRSNILMQWGMEAAEVDELIASGRVVEPIEGFPDYRPPSISTVPVWGYGYYDYVRSTGAQGTHNVALDALYELGVLALLPLLAVGLAVRRSRRVALFLALPIILLWGLSSVTWNDAGGHYAAAVLIAAGATIFRTPHHAENQMDPV